MQANQSGMLFISQPDYSPLQVIVCIYIHTHICIYVHVWAVPKPVLGRHTKPVSMPTAVVAPCCTPITSSHCMPIAVLATSVTEPEPEVTPVTESANACCWSWYTANVCVWPPLWILQSWVSNLFRNIAMSFCLTFAWLCCQRLCLKPCLKICLSSCQAFCLDKKSR